MTGTGSASGDTASSATTEEHEENAEPGFCKDCGSGFENALSPQDLQSAYQLPSSTAGHGQVVAIVDAYDDPHAEQDLATYREAYGLPPCTAEDECFRKVDQRGHEDFPSTNEGWTLEISLDLDMVSATCPNCHILLVEADSEYLNDIAAAVEEAVALGATEVSNSYGAREIEMGPTVVGAYRAPYEHPGVPIVAAGGDDGYNHLQYSAYNEARECLNCSPNFPADIPSVISAGGTTIAPKGESGRGWNEYVWVYSGGGCALYLEKPAWQQEPGCENRMTNDVAAVAGGENALSVYDTVGAVHGWTQAQGTSASSPIIAGALALEEPGEREEGVEGIYNHPGHWFDITGGSNWWSLGAVSFPFQQCKEAHLCVAGEGYDGPTGIGTPNGGASATPPSAITLAPQEVTEATATIRAVVNPEKSSATYHFEFGRTKAYGNNLPTGDAVAGYTMPSVVTANLTGLTRSTKYHYRVVAESEGGTTYGGDRVFSTSPKVHAVNLRLENEDAGAFEKPSDVAVAPNGDIWVTDTANNRIVEFSASGDLIRTCGRLGSGIPEATAEDPGQTDLQFDEPTGIAIDPQSQTEVYVVDRGNDRVQVINSPPPGYVQGCHFRRVFGSEGTGPGELSEPEGIAFGQRAPFLISEGTGEVLVADKGNDRIEAFNPKTGSFLAAYGKAGTGPGELQEPTDVGKDPAHDGQYYVVDSGNGRIEKIATKWQYSTETFSISDEGEFAGAGSGAGALQQPVAIASDPTTGDLLVTDAGAGRVDEFLPNGAYVSHFGDLGTKESAFGEPLGVALDANGTVYVADAGNDRVDVWTPADRQWEISPAVNPTGATDSWLWGVSCRAATSCTAVGDDGSGNGHEMPFAERWDGSEWSSQETPAPTAATAAALEGTSCASLSTCQAVGWYKTEAGVYFSLSESWDGTSWSIRPSPEPLGTLNSVLQGVSCASRTSCVAVGSYEGAGGTVRPFAERWNGSNWTAESTPVPTGAVEAYATGVSCVGSEFCAMAGYYADSSGVRRPFAARSHGSGWTTEELPVVAEATGTELNAVSCTSEASCSTVGTVAEADGKRTGIAERWNGIEWASEAVPMPSGSTEEFLDGIACTSGTSCTTVGVSKGSDCCVTLAEHWDGHEWAVQETPNSAKGQGWLSGGVSCTAGAFCMGVGNTGQALAEVYWDGSTAHEDIAPTAVSLGASDIGSSEANLNGTVNPEGDATSYFFEYGPTTAYGSRTATVDAGSGGGDVSESGHVTGLTPGKTYHFRMVASNAGGTSEGVDVTFRTPLAFSAAFGDENSGAGRLSRPEGIALGPAGNVWVADTSHDRIQEFDAEGRFVRQFGGYGSGDGELRYPSGIAVDAEGNVWVTDTGNYRVEEFNDKGEFMQAFGSYGMGDVQFEHPVGIAIGPEGDIWVADPSSHRIQEFSPEGQFVRQAALASEGESISANGIAVDAEGNLWAAETTSQRVVEFGPQGEFVRQFGSYGSGNGELRSPRGIAIGPEGNVWVADTENNRVQSFSPAGAYLGQFGTAGSNAGELYGPRGIALDAEGDIWVADTGNNRVQEIAGGEYARQFGGAGSGSLSSPLDAGASPEGNVYVVDTEHNAIKEFGPEGQFIRSFGGSGSGPGQLNSPGGIAVSPEGNVYVSDTSNNRLEEFGPEGEFIRQIGGYGPNGSQGGEGYFSCPGGVAVGPEGEVWVAEASNSRLQEFTPGGKFIRQFGSHGTGNGQLASPHDLAVGPEGEVWVADTGNDRVQEFTSEGQFVAKFGAGGEGEGQLSLPYGIGVGPEGEVWVADTGNDRIESFSSSGEYLGQLGASGDNEGQFSKPKGIALDAEGDIWVADTGNNRVQEIAGGEYARQFGGEEWGAGHLSSPRGIALDAEGDIWVADTAHSRIQEFTSKGQFVRQFGSEGSREGQLDYPTGVAVGPKGEVWVADTGNSRIEEFSPDGEFVRSSGSEGAGEGQFACPEGIAVGPKGEVWVADTENSRVEEFTREGEFVSQFGEEGPLLYPDSIAAGPEGNVWVTGPYENRVQELTSEGEFIRYFGSPGSGDGKFVVAGGVAIGPEGEVWASDAYNNRLESFSPDGEYLGSLGSSGDNAGQVLEPTGLAVGPEGEVWVADMGNNRVEGWGH